MKITKAIGILMLISIISCSTDRNQSAIQKFHMNIKNQSLYNVQITGYDFDSHLVKFDYALSPNDTSMSCEYLGEGFVGYACDRVDSIVFRFPNSKGYICTLSHPVSNYNFPSKTLFGSGDMNFSNLGNNNYQFVITQTDYDNAFVLP